MIVRACALCLLGAHMPGRKRSNSTSLPKDEDDPTSRDYAKYADQYVTTKQAAEMFGVVTDHVNRLLIDRKLRGGKLGYSWLVYIPSVEKYRKGKSRRGRPPSGGVKTNKKDDGQA